MNTPSERRAPVSSVPKPQTIRESPSPAKPLPSLKTKEEWLKESDTLYDLKRNEEALAAYEQAIRLDPNYDIAYYNKGLALDALGKKQKAQQAYERARQLGYSS